MHDAVPVFSGALPNIYHHALNPDHHRHLPTLTALPPVDSICISGPASYRYIRQDDDLWDRLHSGTCTSGYLSAALGLFEAAPAKRLRLSKSKVSHFPLLNAYTHLSKQPYIPSINENITEESALQHNARVTLAYNENKIGSGGWESGESIIVAKMEELVLEKEAEAVANGYINTITNPIIDNGGPNKKKGRRNMKPVTSPGATTLSYQFSEELKLKKARALSSQGIDGVRCAWGKVQESTTLHVLGTCIFPSAEISEAGLFILNEMVLPQEWNFLPGELPPIGSSPDALLQHPLGALEVVEVKNTCPFDYSLQKNYRGGKKKKFVVCDRGPRNQLDVLWVPQIQLHMLCTQTSSALLVSRSATRGIKVFRVKADSEFQRLMLCLLRKLYTEHVIPQIVPLKDVFEHIPEHGELIKRIRRCVDTAEVVAEISGEEAKKALFENDLCTRVDSRFFLD
jgi:hypothetical protein